jgi:hydroxymethylpyrimidine/phosphomethylpyrimidine kinase
LLSQLEQLSAQLAAENRPSRALKEAIAFITREIKNGT